MRAAVEQAVADLLERVGPKEHDPVSFRGAQFDAGLAWVHHPIGLGGLGLAPELQGVVDAALSAAGAPGLARECLIGLGMAAPTLVTHAHPQLLERHLRPIFTGEEVWCQLFSEPGAGSDLAGLSTSAVQVPGGWSITGQKVWTSVAHLADRGLLLARTDPDLPKHKGLSYFVLDMRAPGVDVRPLYQITGEAEFNEVYLDEVFVPSDCMLGEPGDGWKVAMTTLMNERSALSSSSPGLDPMAAVLERWKATGEDDPATRDRLVQLWIRTQLAVLTSVRAAEAGRRGSPGPEASVGKLQWSGLAQELTEAIVDLMGVEAVLYPPGYELHRTEATQMEEMDPRAAYLWARSLSIGGGTSEIMRNVIGERVLGLPEEPRVDKDLPWRKTLRG